MTLAAVFLGDLTDGDERLLVMVPQESLDGESFHTLTVLPGAGPVAASEDYFILSIGLREGDLFTEKAQVSLRKGLGRGRSDFKLSPPVRVVPGAVAVLRALANGQPAPLEALSVIPQCGTLASWRLS